MNIEIVKYPHPVLKMKCLPLRRFDAELRDAIPEMFRLMYENNGVGLAANQVGLPYRFFIMNPSGKAEEKDKEFLFINPQILLGSGHPVCGEEGCLSFPKIYTDVFRAPKVTIRGYDLQGNPVSHTLEGFAARIVQHEFDHLDGFSFLDRRAEDVPEVLDALDEQIRRFRQDQADGKIPSDAELEKEIQRLLELRT
ncbi:MAG: peptide deformylase [Planctomycetia bacterium]|nr:peptide deformylase [Planctomycetia bacterium]